MFTHWFSSVGRSHNADYVLFSTENLASEKVKQFAEHGDMNLIQAEGQGHGFILDSFTTPAIGSGDGQAAAIFLASSNHSRVSAVLSKQDLLLTHVSNTHNTILQCGLGVPYSQDRAQP